MIALLSIGCVPSGAGRPAPESEWVRVEDLMLPRQSGTHAVYAVEEIPDEALGSAVRYAVPDSVPMRLPPFDLFVYPAARPELEAEAAAARAELRMMDQLRPDVESVIGATDTITTTHGAFPILRTTVEARVGADSVRSFLYLSRVQQRYLKVRVSYLADAPISIDRAMHRRVERLFDDIARQAAQ